MIVNACVLQVSFTNDLEQRLPSETAAEFDLCELPSCAYPFYEEQWSSNN